MIDRDQAPFTVYASGHCDAACWECDWTKTYDSLAQAFTGWRQHRKTCPPMGAPRANENAPTNPRKDQ